MSNYYLVAQITLTAIFIFGGIILAIKLAKPQ